MSLFGKGQERPPEAPVPPRPQPLPAATAPAAACVIGSKTLVKGDISGDEDVRVEGTVEGTVKIARRLVVAAGGTVKANVEARSVVIAGEVVGDCTATERFEIEASGRLTGNIKAPKVVIAEGAVFRGQSDMTSGSNESGRAAS